jgi:hypothetical protein
VHQWHKSIKVKETLEIQLYKVFRMPAISLCSMMPQVSRQ